MNTEVEKFRQYLEDNAKKWSDIPVKVNLGALKLSEQFIQEIVINEQVDIFWELFANKMPSDTVIMDMDGIRLLQHISDGAYAWGYTLILGSKDFEPSDKDGGVIPSLDITFTREEVDEANAKRANL